MKIKSRLSILKVKKQFKIHLSYSKLSKNPEKTINGTIKGPDIAKAIFTEGEIAETNVPNANEACTTKLIITKHIMNLLILLFKLAIQ